MKLTFLGAVGTVTGSKYLVEHGSRRILVDCGLFQGYKQLRLRNWAPLPISPQAIDAVLLTHAHIDHSGYLPLLVKHGFKGPIYATDATNDLCEILLPDSGHLQEQDALFANRHHFSKHKPALPLYTEKDAYDCLKQFRSVSFGKILDIFGVNVRYLRAGHILGAAMIEMAADTKIVFSGDVGRPNDIAMLPPEMLPETDFLVVESTYGNRTHNGLDAEDALADAINETARRGGTVVIPAFAVGRTQTLLLHLSRLLKARRIPALPIFLDSPMAINASDIFCRHPKDHKISAAETREAFSVARYVRTAEESKTLDSMVVPKVIISASGMATGGRVLHHLKSYAPDHRSLILFTGFQSGGTRGATMVAGGKTVKIHGDYFPVRAEVRNLDMLSAHADANEIVAWLKKTPKRPGTTFITHGEPDAADTLRRRISEELGWSCIVPEYRETVSLQ
jgi:metallo-beta-lactamase family protein